MKLGIDSFSFHIQLAAGRYDVFRTFDWMQAQGLSGLQININGPQGRFLGADPSDTGHLKRVRSRLESLGFFAEIGGGLITAAALVEQQLQLAADLGADTLRTVVGFNDSLDATIALARQSLEKVLPLAHRLGVRIAIENHEDVTAGELRVLLDAIDDPLVGACIDTGNDVIVYGDPLDATRQLLPRAMSTHIKDQRLVRVGGAVYCVGVPLGTGDIDLPGILDVIGRETTLDRILIQDTTGYSAPLNKFNRPDLQPTTDYPDIPSFADVAELVAAGFRLNLEGLPPAALAALATQQDRNLEDDTAYIRRLCRNNTMSTT